MTEWSGELTVFASADYRIVPIFIRKIEPLNPCSDQPIANQKGDHQNRMNVISHSSPSIARIVDCWVYKTSPLRASQQPVSHSYLQPKQTWKYDEIDSWDCLGLFSSPKKQSMLRYGVRLKESACRSKLYINQDMISCESSCENNICINTCWLASKTTIKTTYVRDGRQQRSSSGSDVL